MQPYDSCRLIHLNLTSFVKHAYYPDASLGCKNRNQAGR